MDVGSGGLGVDGGQHVRRHNRMSMHSRFMSVDDLADEILEMQNMVFVDERGDEEALAEAFRKANDRLAEEENDEDQMDEDARAAEARSIAQTRTLARLQEWAEASGDVFLFGSNAMMQLGKPGAERKLLPYPLTFAKTKRIIYLHADNTSNFAISADRRMYFWGSTPMNPNLSRFSAADVQEQLQADVAGGYGDKTGTTRAKMRSYSIEQQRRKQAIAKWQEEQQQADDLVKLCPEFERFRNGGGNDGVGPLTEDEIACLPHAFQPPWNVRQEPVVWLSCGVEHVCGVTAIGRVFTYGSGDNGRLGNGSSDNVLVPRFINFVDENDTADDHYKDETTRSRHKKGGSVSVGGDESVMPRAVRQTLEHEGDQVISCHCGSDFTALLTRKGDVYTFGAGEASQLGIRGEGDHILPALVPITKSLSTKDNAPQDSSAPIKIVGLAVGAHHCLAQTSKGEIISWGLNTSGQCGVGHLEPVEEPTMIMYSRKRAVKKPKEFGDVRKRLHKKKVKEVERLKKAERQKKDQDLEYDAFLHQKVAQDEAASDSSFNSDSSDNLPKWEARTEKYWIRVRKKGIPKTPADNDDEAQEREKIEKRWEARKAKEAKFKEMRQAEDDKTIGAQKRDLMRRRRELLENKFYSKRQRHKQARFRAWKRRHDARKGMHELPDSQDVSSKSPLNKLLGTSISTSPINFVSVAAGPLFSAAITEDGNLYMWGDNGNGQLGNGTNKDQKVPTFVSDLSYVNVVQVACGRKHTVALTSKGAVYVWGYNGDGQLGTGSRSSTWVPVQLMSLRRHKIAIVSCGLDHTVCLEGRMKSKSVRKPKFLDSRAMKQEIKLKHKKERKERAWQRKRGIFNVVPITTKQDEQRLLQSRTHKADAVSGDDLFHTGVVVKPRGLRGKTGRSKRMMSIASVNMSTATKLAAKPGDEEANAPGL